jgi:hypothetical protein
MGKARHAGTGVQLIHLLFKKAYSGHLAVEMNPAITV